MNGSHLRVESHLGNWLIVPKTKTLCLFIATCHFDLLKQVPLDPWPYSNSRPFFSQSTGLDIVFSAAILVCFQLYSSKKKKIYQQHI